MKKIRILVPICLTILVCSQFALNAAWMETHNLSLGNLSGRTQNGSLGAFMNIPESPFILLSMDKNFLTYEIDSNRCRDSIHYDINISNSVIMPEPSSGWKLYYTSNGFFGYLDIYENGEFGVMRRLPKAYDRGPSSIGVPERFEIWYFTDRIMRLDTITEEWDIYGYPEGWDREIRYCYLYPSEDLNTVFARGKSETLNDYQAMEFDLLTGEWTPNPWVRGACLYGMMPANGLTYAPPHPCACYIESKLNGFNALAVARADRRGPSARDHPWLPPCRGTRHPALAR